MEIKVQETPEQVLDRCWSYFQEEWPHKGMVHKNDNAVWVVDDGKMSIGEIALWAIGSLLTGGLLILVFGIYLVTRSAEYVTITPIPASKGEGSTIRSDGTKKHLLKVDKWITKEFTPQANEIAA